MTTQPTFQPPSASSGAWPISIWRSSTLETTKTRPLAWVDKPWGRYMVVSETPQSAVKILRVLPGHELSLQRHNHRDESWTLLTRNGGIVLFTIGEYVLTALNAACYD